MLCDDIVHEAVNSVESQTLIVVRAEIGEDCRQSKIIEMLKLLPYKKRPSFPACVCWRNVQ